MGWEFDFITGVIMKLAPVVIGGLWGLYTRRSADRRFERIERRLDRLEGN
jgi:hypothetical protein